MEQGMDSKMIGSEIIGYKVTACIGEGGMGKIYLAENAIIGQKVAIKVLDSILARNEVIRERFTQEARIQVSLQHNNIVRVLNVHISEEMFCLILELVEGESLDKVLERRGSLDLDESLKIMKQVMDAVGYAHNHGVIHRDLKPANILVCADGTAKVTDFGIAKVLGDSRLTCTGTSMGSPAYMSPEQVLGTKDIDNRTDIYSLGAMLFEMLTGRPPFTITDSTANDSEFLTKQAHVQTSPTDPRTFAPDIPEKIAKAILRSLAKDKNDRFSNTHDFGESLKKPGMDATEYPHPVRANSPGCVTSDTRRETQTLGDDPPSQRKRRSFPGGLGAFVLVCSVALLCYSLIEIYKSTQKQNLVKLSEQAIAIYKSGQLVKARAEFVKACDGGIADACFRLGRMIDKGEGGTESQLEARRLFEKACSENHAESCRNLGIMELNGEGGSKDEFSASRHLWKACLAGSVEGCRFAIFEVEIGGGSNNMWEVKSILQSTCSTGDNIACFHLGYMLEEGIGGAREEEKAKLIYDKACKKDLADACLQLASMKYRNSDPDKEKSDHNNNRTDCNNGKSDACSYFGYMLEHGWGGPLAPWEAREWYRKGCDGGSLFGCTALGDMLKNGLGGDRDVTKAKQLFEKACKGGHKIACAR
jgi:serine/threonine protein kinase